MNIYAGGNEVRVPKYVQLLLSGSRFEFGICHKHPEYAAGYTIRIRKPSDYQTAKTFNAEIARLQKWVNRLPGGHCEILSTPKETHHRTQNAVVTIYDPIMLQLEKLNLIKG